MFGDQYRLEWLGHRNNCDVHCAGMTRSLESAVIKNHEVAPLSKNLWLYAWLKQTEIKERWRYFHFISFFIRQYDQL